MLNLLTKTGPWLASTLLVAAALSANEETSIAAPQKLDHREEAPKHQMIHGYSAPARIEVRGSWDVYATASFIYWQARQENMEIGIVSRNNPEILDLPFGTTYVNNMTLTNPNFTYRPGFKVGLGVNLDWDNWDAYAEYTWFHGSTNSGVRPLSRATTGIAIPSNGEYLYPIQGAPGALTTLFFQSANQSWDLKMDFLDLSLSRSYYSGRRLTITPFFGARGGWIRQHLNTEYVGTVVTRATGDNLATLHDETASWGVGPRTGFESNWLLGYGTRFIGNFSGDILYSRFHLHQDGLVTDLRPSESSDPIRSNAAISQTIDYLRAHADFELGFGWGTYFDNHNWHIDLSATYGFQAFWDQNMFRNFEGDFVKSFAPNGNLYVHGLTMNADFDF